MRAHGQASTDDIDLSTVGVAIKKRLPKLLLTSAIVGAATAGVLSQMLPKYVAQAQLEVMSTGISSPLDPKRDGAPSDVASRMDKEAIGTHVGALKSTDLALKLTKDAKLASRAEFNSALPAPDTFSALLRLAGVGAPRPGETDEDRVLNAYYKALKVFQLRDSRQITVEFTTSDPKFSAELANRLAEQYRESLTGRTIIETEDASAKLKPQVERLSRETAEAETAVTRMRGETNIFRGGTQNTGLNEQQLSDLAIELTRAQTARSESDARVQAARDMSIRGTAEALPDVQKSTLVPRLVEQRVRLERQISELSASLLPAHPRMRQLTADLAGLQRQIKSEVQKVVDSIEKDAKISADREVNLKRRLDDAKSRVVSSGSNEAKLRALEETAKAKRVELERLQKQFESAASTVGTKVVPVEVKLISKAFPSNEKVWPKMGIAPLAALATFLLGLAWTFTRELFSGARQNPLPEVTATRMAPTLDTMARQSAPVQAKPAALAAPAAVAAPLAEAAPASETTTLTETIPAQSGQVHTITETRDVAALLVARPKAQAGCRTLLTGESPSSDATDMAIDLTRNLAKLGAQVVLIDWDLDGAALAAKFGGQAGPGMHDLLAGEASFEDVIQRLPDTEAHVVTGGTRVFGASTEIDPDRANLVLDALDEAYDHIVVTASHARARALFSATQGRFDIGIVAAAPQQSRSDVTRAGTFLGFEVSDLDVVRIAAPPKEQSISAMRRLVAKPGQPGAQARA